MKLNIKEKSYSQADPFIFEDDGKFYLYVTAGPGVKAYSSTDLFGEWKYEGVVTAFKEGKNFWAPSVIKLDGVYYMYVSFEIENEFEFMYVAKSTSPLGPFSDEKKLYDKFSIDSHVVQNENGLFLWFACNDYDAKLIGTCVYIDRLLDPYTPEYKLKKVIGADFKEERFTPHCRDGRIWHTIEGPFYFYEDGYHYVMYSGGCYLDDTYHVGYAYAKSEETDLTKIDFIKKKDNDKFAPVIIKNEFEEGTGHHSVIKHKGEYYAIYHARDYGADTYHRTARICKLTVDKGEITAKRFIDKV